MKYKAKPIKWEHKHLAKSVTHVYNIVPDLDNSPYVIYYHELHTGNTNSEPKETYEDVVDWIENKHAPSKLLDWFDIVKGVIMPKARAQIETPTKSYVVKYQQAVDAAVEQQNIFWAAEKMGVDADEQDFRTKLSEGENHAVLLLQSILTQYELMIGGTEMWGGKIAKMFPRPEIQRMCATFAYAELASHAPFYKEGNKVLGRDTEEFYESCLEIPELADHLKYVESLAKSKNPLEVTAAVCFLEGVVLFSAFAFFKSFNTNGFNLIPHFVAGIDASAKDENFHSQASAWLHNTCKQERELLGLETYDEDMITNLAIESYQHEAKIIELLYSVKPETMRTINKEDLLHFIRDRTNLVCGYLNTPPIFDQEKGVVSEWFYNNLSSFKSSDFFASTQVQYTKNHNKAALGFNTRGKY